MGGKKLDRSMVKQVFGRSRRALAIYMLVLRMRFDDEDEDEDDSAGMDPQRVMAQVTQADQ